MLACEKVKSPAAGDPPLEGRTGKDPLDLLRRQRVDIERRFVCLVHDSRRGLTAEQCWSVARRPRLTKSYRCAIGASTALAGLEFRPALIHLTLIFGPLSSRNSVPPHGGLPRLMLAGKPAPPRLHQEALSPSQKKLRIG